ncbi:MAG: hypothetical protein A2665_02400 [Candidatus Zambryskibacteria bacterium RIFCSPHIGHO2_01_FULL_46_30]|uniref:Uncharacterized protein n=1 Tax=Candidatus Zambryskibacteria bacterium RIFCSPHIGHO2_01_FULL_46_30 TaxID=1802739 RepID=A0A1G2T6A9_9BACT|nr:MAG: hypothetical protein A2665_02400 [Candidatus Zambryskibacteria bacterium RIFCSPHIGHO2_01_FULL_46_30]OHB06237.1 MAG: hypothetical protein A3B22_00025 [Candidatus Zambryskibacteria bacterium RIFCSPLOWO2_01_FULL_47_33]
MSPIRLTIALTVSVALISGAMWFRFVRIPPYSAQLVSVKAIEQLPPEEAFLEGLSKTDASLYATSTATLSQTDLIGRKLFLDFMALKSQGQATPENIKALADRYAEEIKNFEISIPKVNLDQIIVLLDSEENLAKYGNTMASIRNKYKNLVATQVENSGGDIKDTGSQAFSTFMGAVGKLYQASANELVLVGVPATLASNHLDLINNHLESAEVMASISNTSQDPVRAYAALNIYAQHTEKEAGLFLNIQKVMMANGIILESGV